MATPAPPPYDAIYGKVKNHIGDNPTPEKLLDAISALAPLEIDAVKNAPFDPEAHISKIDKNAFEKGLQEYLKSEAAQQRLKLNAETATNSCKLIDQMFNNLAVKLGEVDGKKLAKDPYLPRFLELQQTYRNILHKSKDLAIKMSNYGLKFKDMILPICLDSRLDSNIKQAKLQQCIKTVEGFETESVEITNLFSALKTNFGAFTGSFNSWAENEEKKDDPEMKEISDGINVLEAEIAEYRSKILKCGVIGGPSTVGGTALLCAFLGPVGLIAGLIGAGATIGFMVYWSTQITEREEDIRKKKDRLKVLQTQKDSIIATRSQLRELGENSLNIFNEQINNLNNVWAVARNDCVNIGDRLKTIDSEVEDLSHDILRTYIMPMIGGTTALYETMALYLQRYADGVSASEIPEPKKQ